MKTIKTLLMLILPLIWGQQIHAQTYVDANANGANDGSSWADAYNTLHDALEAYSAGDEIWVAAGTYIPRVSSAWVGPPLEAFYLHQDVSLFGGFNGTETLRSERDPSVNLTFLSGDRLLDDIPGNFTINRSDNYLKVIFVDSTISNATVIDGFTISGGHADIGGGLYSSRGAGIWSVGSPQIRHCTFTENYTLDSGSGMYLRGESAATATISDCRFEGNATATIGAGLVIFTSDSSRVISISDCTFANNESGSDGAGFAIGSSSVELTNCQFTENASQRRGGGLYFIPLTGEGTGFQLSLTDCRFEGNTANGGGGFHYETVTPGDNQLTFTSCEFVDNHSFGNGFLTDGGAIQVYYGDFQVQRDTISLLNCLFDGNTSERVGGAVQFWNSNGADNHFDLIGCTFLNNEADWFGGGFRMESSSPNASLRIEDCLFDGNIADIDGGGAEVVHWAMGNAQTSILHTQFLNNSSPNEGAGLNLFLDNGASGSMMVSDCLFSGNTNDSTGNAEEGAGGFSLNNFGVGIANVSIMNCVFDSNFSADGAGAIQLYKRGNTTTDFVYVENCQLSHNTGGDYGGGMGVFGNINVELTGNTIADNTGPGIAYVAGSISMQNNLLANPGTDDLWLVSTDSLISRGGNLISDSTMAAYLDSTDQSNVDPRFEADSYELSASSPAIDAGIVPTNFSATDLGGNARIQGGCIDIGAWESPYDLGLGCVATNPTTSIWAPLTASVALSLYPNPAVNSLTVSLAGMRPMRHGHGLSLRIMNTMGQVVQTADMGQRDSMELDIRNLPAGTYRVMVSDRLGMMVESFVKSR